MMEGDGTGLNLSKMDFDLNELLRLEAVLKTSRESEESRDTLDAKVNILKYLQVQAVLRGHAEYDDLYYELNKTGGLDCLRSITPARSRDLLQPKVLELPDCGEEERFEKQLQFYLEEAELAKQPLDELVMKVGHDSSDYEVQCTGVKSRESTRRQARAFYSGDVRKVADLARVSVICNTPEALKEAYLAIIGLLEGDVLRVSNGFISDWMPGGYRGVKLNPVVNEHLCEIQLSLRKFFMLRGSQHALYEFARDLEVTTHMRAEHLFSNLSPDVTKEMLRLAGLNWRGSGYCLPDLQFAAGQYDLANNGFQQQLRDAEYKAREFEDQTSKESRRALLRANTAREKLAQALQQQGKYEEAGPLYQKAVEIGEKTLGPEHPDVASALNNWAGLLMAQGKYEEAGPLCQKAVEIGEKTLGPEHPDVASALNNWAGLLMAQGKYEEAGPLYQKAVEIGEKTLGPEHPDVASALNNWAGLLMAQGKYEEADPLYRRAVHIRETTLGPEHPHVASALNDCAGLLMAQGKYEEAGPLCRRAVEIGEKSLGPDHSDVASGLNNWAKLLTAQGKYEEAAPLFERSLAIREKSLGPDHPDVATALNNWAEGLSAQGKLAEAEAVYGRSCAIREKVLGPHHPDVAQSLNNRATLLKEQGKFAEAEPLYKRSLEIYRPDRPKMVTVLNNWAELLEAQGDIDGARRLREHIRAINDADVNWDIKGCQFTKEAPSGVDRLNYDAYAQALAGLFITGEGDVLPAAVGIYAPWGSGKSFLLDHLKSRLQDPPAPPSLSATCCCCLAGLRNMICHSVWVVIMLAIFNGLQEWFGSCCAALRRSDAAIPKALVAFVGRCGYSGARKRTDGQLRDVEASLELDASGGRAFIVVEFNAWECAGMEILWAVVTAKLFDAIESHPDFGRGAVRAARIKKLLKDPSWNWCGLVTFFFAVALLGCGVVIALIATDAWDDISQIGNSVQWIVATLLLPGVLTVLKFLVQIRSRGSFRTAHSVLRKAISNTQSVGKPYEGFMSEVKEELEMLFHLINTFNSEVERQRRKDAGEEAETGKPRKTLALAVIVDDLDRCSREKIMEMLRATHLLLEQPKAPMAVFLAVDPQLIVSAISESLEGVSNMMKALQYLDKIIHLPFCIPALKTDQKHRLLDYLLSASDNSCRSTLKLMKTILNAAPTEDARRTSSEAVNEYPWPVPVNKVGKELVCILHWWSQDKVDPRAEEAGKALENFRKGLTQSQDAPSRNRHASCVKGLEDLSSIVNKLISNSTSTGTGDDATQEAGDLTVRLPSPTGSFQSPGGGLPSTGPAVATPGGPPRRSVPSAEGSTPGTAARPGGGPGVEGSTLQTAPRPGSVLGVGSILQTSTTVQTTIQTFNRMISEDEKKIFKALIGIVNATPRKIKRVVNVYFLQRSVVEKLPAWKRDSSTRAEFVAWTILAEFWPFRLSCIAFAMMNDAPKDKPRKENYLDSATIAEVYGSPAGETSTSVCMWINNYRGKGTPKELFQSDDTEGRFQMAMKVAMDEGVRITKRTVENCLLHNSFNLNPAIMSTIEVDMVYDSTETTESKSSDET